MPPEGAGELVFEGLAPGRAKPSAGRLAVVGMASADISVVAVEVAVLCNGGCMGC